MVHYMGCVENREIKVTIHPPNICIIIVLTVVVGIERKKFHNCLQQFGNVMSVGTNVLRTSRAH